MNRVMLKQLTAVGTSERTRQCGNTTLCNGMDFTCIRKGCSNTNTTAKKKKKKRTANQKLTKQEMAQLCLEEEKHINIS